MLDYVGRYTHRIAISNERLLDIDGERVTFRYKDYRVAGPQTSKTMTLDALEFIRRFLMHVLPPGFHRIRYYGLKPPRDLKSRRSPGTDPRGTRDARKDRPMGEASGGSACVEGDAVTRAAVHESLCS